jgi:hypothetical protein
MIRYFLSHKIGRRRAYATGIVARIGKILDVFLGFVVFQFLKRFAHNGLAAIAEALTVCYHD